MGNYYQPITEAQKAIQKSGLLLLCLGFVMFTAALTTGSKNLHFSIINLIIALTLAIFSLKENWIFKHGKSLIIITIAAFLIEPLLLNLPEHLLYDPELRPTPRHNARRGAGPVLVLLNVSSTYIYLIFKLSISISLISAYLKLNSAKTP